MRKGCERICVKENRVKGYVVSNSDNEERHTLSVASQPRQIQAGQIRGRQLVIGTYSTCVRATFVGREMSEDRLL